MDVAPVSRPVEGGVAPLIAHRVNGSACLEQQVRDGKFPQVSRTVEGGPAIKIVHRVNGSACLEEQVRDGKIPSVSRKVEGVKAILLQGQFVVKAGEKVETRGVSC